MEEERLLI